MFAAMSKPLFRLLSPLGTQVMALLQELNCNARCAETDSRVTARMFIDKDEGFA